MRVKQILFNSLKYASLGTFYHFKMKLSLISIKFSFFPKNVSALTNIVHGYGIFLSLITTTINCSILSLTKFPGEIHKVKTMIYIRTIYLSKLFSEYNWAYKLIHTLSFALLFSLNISLNLLNRLTIVFHHFQNLPITNSKTFKKCLTPNLPASCSKQPAILFILHSGKKSATYPDILKDDFRKLPTSYKDCQYLYRWVKKD